MRQEVTTLPKKNRTNDVIHATCVNATDLELRAVLHLGLASPSVGVADLEHARVTVVRQLENEQEQEVVVQKYQVQ